MNKLLRFVSLAVVAVFSVAGPAEAGSIYHKNWIDFNKNGRKDIYEDPSKPLADRVEDLLSQMTVEEKTCQLATLYGFRRVLADSLPTPEWKQRVWKDGIANIDEMLNGVGKAYDSHRDMIYPYANHVKALHQIQRFFVEETRLGIPVEFSNEGIHGLNHTMATPLPAPIGIGSTWNRALVHQAGLIAGEEAALIGYHSVYAPILDVARDPRWGRIVETYGEDPFLIAELGVQMAKGVQRDGVACCLKHFAAYSTPKGGRDGSCRTDPHISPRELHEMHLYPFQRVIEEAHPMEVMSSYNDWNGDPVSGSHYFLTELLRDTYGFDGYVVSDSDAVEFIQTKHQVVGSYEEAAALVVSAGLNVRTNFTAPEVFVHALRAAIDKGYVQMDVIDRRVREVLGVKFRLGLFDNPYTGELSADLKAGYDKHEDFVHEMGSQAVVLLKNQDELLPLDKTKIGRLLVTGPMADATDFMSSRYGPNGIAPISMLGGIRDYLGSSDVQVDYELGCTLLDEGWPQTEILPLPITEEEQARIDAAVRKAMEADVVVAVMGEDDTIVGESHSRTSLDLPGRQLQFLQALYATGKPVVLVLINGQPLTINWPDVYLPAILEMWFPTYMGGRILAETLFGDNNPSGKLTVTFPRTVGQIEYNFPYKKGSHGAQPMTGPNGGGKTRIIGELYPFGHGLSYTSFAYEQLELAPQPDGTIEVSADITNTGQRKGTEVVQLYVSDLVSSVVTYQSVLRGFERVSLEPGQTAKVVFTLTPRDLQILDKDMNWTVEPGDFQISLGSSSTDIRLAKTISLPATPPSSL